MNKIGIRSDLLPFEDEVVHVFIESCYITAVVSALEREKGLRKQKIVEVVRRKLAEEIERALEKGDSE